MVREVSRIEAGDVEELDADERGLKTRIFIGTSGWHYKHWLEGVFYPPGTKGATMFDYYARHFNTVEINNSFYRLPAAKTFSLGV